MKANLKAPSISLEFADGVAMRIIMFAASLGFLFYLWTLNYNKLGSFYDYSIMTDAAGKFGAGLRPYSDFHSALQTFSFWVVRGCELLFGPRYLALAYGNLVLSLIFFTVVVQFAKRTLHFAGAALTGVAITVASTLQHGIVWYNSLALVLLSAITLKCADLLRSRTIGPVDAVLVLTLLVLIGITKVNFYVVAIIVVAGFALAGSLSSSGSLNWKKIVAWTALAAAVCSTPPIIEAFTDHATLSDWMQQVIRTPGDRARLLVHVFDWRFYIREWNPYYPKTVLQGSVLFCLTVYGFLTLVAVNEFRVSRVSQVRAFRPLMIQLGMISMLWGSTCLLVLTNIEIESLCLSFCLVGVLAMQISGQFPGSKWEKVIQVSSIVLAIYLLLVGGVSLTRHARISLGDWEGIFSRNVVPQEDSRLAYLRGVALSPKATRRLAAIDELIKENRNVPVYWGPGLELMNRIYGGVVSPEFPMWYELGTTTHQADAQRLIDAIELSGAGLVVADRVYSDRFPDGVRRHLDSSWSVEKPGDPLVIWKKPLAH
jgi:hypothetical protein